MTDINALIFALAFTMAFMLLIGAYTRIELKKEPVHIYRTRLQQAFYVVTQPTVVITTTLLLSLSWCAALDSGSFAYALLMLHGLRAKYALAINLIILLNFQSMLHCIYVAIASLASCITCTLSTSLCWLLQPQYILFRAHNWILAPHRRREVHTSTLKKHQQP